jgi:hypothetical protein
MDRKPRKPTIRQQRFAEGLLQGKSGAQAARDAGYSKKNARVQASQNLTKLNIQRRIQERLSEARVSSDEVLATLSAQMRSDITDLLGVDGELSLHRIRRRRLGHLIKRLRVRRTYERRGKRKVTADIIDVELHSSQVAALGLARIMGMVTERVEHTGGIIDLSALRERMAHRLADEHGRSVEEVLSDLEGL